MQTRNCRPYFYTTTQLLAVLALSGSFLLGCGAATSSPKSSRSSAFVQDPVPPLGTANTYANCVGEHPGPCQAIGDGLTPGSVGDGHCEDYQAGGICAAGLTDVTGPGCAISWAGCASGPSISTYIDNAGIASKLPTVDVQTVGYQSNTCQAWLATVVDVQTWTVTALDQDQTVSPTEAGNCIVSDTDNGDGTGTLSVISEYKPPGCGDSDVGTAKCGLWNGAPTFYCPFINPNDPIFSLPPYSGAASPSGAHADIPWKAGHPPSAYSAGVTIDWQGCGTTSTNANSVGCTCVCSPGTGTYDPSTGICD